LPTHLVPFLLAHPNIDVDLEERPSHAIVEAVAGGRAEIGIVADSVNLGQLDRVPLRSDDLVLLVAPGHHHAERSRIRFHEILGLPFVGLGEGSALQEHLEGHALPLGQRPAYRVRLPSVEAVCQAVSAGVGVSILPDAVVRQWQARGPLATVPLEDRWAARQLVLCRDPDTQLSVPAGELAAHLVASMSSSLSTRR
jgi:DNA-binding transcriptional LysR family regulator